MSVPHPPHNNATTSVPQGKVKWEWISESWRLFKEDAGTWIGATVVYGAIVIALSAGIMFWIMMPVFSNPMGFNQAQFAAHFPWDKYAIFYIAVGGSEIFALASMMRMTVKKVRGEMLNFSDAFGGMPCVPNMLWLIFLTFLIDLPGSAWSLSLNFSHPAAASQNSWDTMKTIYMSSGVSILWQMIVLSFCIPAYAMAADKVPGHRALAQSFRSMARQFFPAFLFVLGTGFLFAVGSILTCMLGTVAIVPVACLISALAYRDMVGMPGMRIPQQISPEGWPAAAGTWPPAPGTWPPAPTKSSQHDYGQAQPSSDDGTITEPSENSKNDRP